MNKEDNYIRFEMMEKTIKEIEDALFIAKTQMVDLKQELKIEEPKKKKKTIVFDFDGVIHTGYEGYKDGTIYGKIDYNMLDYIYELQKEYYIVISSNRPAAQIVEYMNRFCSDNYINLSFEIFNKSDEELYWLVDDVIGVTNSKAIGSLYIDDRGYRYRGLEDLKEYIEVFGVELQ